MPYILDGRQLTVGRSFKTSDGTSYSQLWVTALSEDEKTAIGITYQAEPETFDRTFYSGPGVARDLATVKKEFTNLQKASASNFLTPTDWYVTRKAESDTAIPSDVATYRAAVRTVCGTREAEIAAVSTTEALEALIKAPDKITNDAGEVVDNPAAHLTPWPVLA